MSLFRLARPAFALQPARQVFVRRTFLTTRSLFSEQPATPLSSEQQPTVLSSLQPELKSAMRAKDKARLTAIRSLMADITNASKTPKPIDNDVTLYSLLTKQIKAGEAAVEDFLKAKREDLVEKERIQVNILKEYRDKIDNVVTEQEVDELKSKIMEGDTQITVGTMMGKIMAHFKHRPFDGEMVNRVVRSSL